MGALFGTGLVIRSALFGTGLVTGGALFVTGLVAGSALSGTFENLVREPSSFGTVKKNILVAQQTLSGGSII